jgi:hypothetical protein
MSTTEIYGPHGDQVWAEIVKKREQREKYVKAVIEQRNKIALSVGTNDDPTFRELLDRKFFSVFLCSFKKFDRCFF